MSTRHTSPKPYRALLTLEERILRVAIAKRLTARDADVELGGKANRVRHPTLGHAAAERLIPGEDAPATEMVSHIQRYLWAFEVVEGKRVLDVGCGAGYGSSLLSWVAGTVEAVDLDPEAIAHAQARYNGPVFSVQDVTEPLPSAEVATCFEVLEHVHDPDALCSQLLASAPELLISYPNPLAAGPHLNPHHVVDWPLRTLRKALRSAGALDIRGYHQRPGGPSVRRGTPPWATVWLLHVTR